MLNALKTVIQSVFRFFPFQTETGIRILGDPGRESPVYATCNYDLTVRRVMKALRTQDCYLLVAPSKGVNVWCAAGGGMFNAHSVTSVLKTSGIDERVSHRTLILPQLSAPGIDIERVEEETGWRCKFGPVYARDIPRYESAGQKTETMRQAMFPLGDRLQMAVMWAAPMSIVAAIPVALISLGTLPGVLALIWGFSLFLFALYEPIMRFVPGAAGLIKVLLLGLAGVIGVVAYGWLVGGWTTSNIIGWSLGILTVALLLGFDLDGSSPLHAGSTVAYWGKKWPWVHKIWAKVGYEVEEYFSLEVDRKLCTGCATCVDVCPKDVFDLYQFNGGQRSWVARPDDCEQCTACVKQCPEGAILADPPITLFT